MKIFKTDEEYYNDIEYLSNSQVQDWLKCPHYFQVKHIDKTFKEESEPDYFIYGRAFDACITEPERFKNDFITVDRRVNVKSKIIELETDIDGLQSLFATAPNKRTETSLEKKKEKLKEVQAIAGKTQITPLMKENIESSILEFKRQPLIQKFDFQNSSLQEIITVEIDGIKRKGKLDYFNKEKKIIADYKTTANIETFDPRRYIHQLANYYELVVAKYGSEMSCECYLIVVDKDNNTRSAVYLISNSWIGIGIAQNQAVVKEIKKQMDSGFFVPIPEKIMEIYGEEKYTRFSCPDYAHCPFAIQKEIVVV